MFGMLMMRQNDPKQGKLISTQNMQRKYNKDPSCLR